MKIDKAIHVDQYIDSHMLRPFHQYRDQLIELLSLIDKSLITSEVPIPLY